MPPRPRIAASSLLALASIATGAARATEVPPAALPTDFYGDASHPLPEGYRTMAAQLLKDGAFTAWLGQTK